MTDVLDKAADAIKERIAELDDERKRLENALASLAGARRGLGRPRGSHSRPQRSSAKRARRGERQKQLLASIQRNPSFKVADHARQIGVPPSQAHALTSKLMKDRKVRKTSGGKLRLIEG